MGPFQGPVQILRVPSSSFKLPSSASPYTLKINAHLVVCGPSVSSSSFFFFFPFKSCLNYKNFTRVNGVITSSLICKPHVSAAPYCLFTHLKQQQTSTLPPLSEATAAELPASYIKHCRAFLQPFLHWGSCICLPDHGWDSSLNQESNICL